MANEYRPLTAEQLRNLFAQEQAGQVDAGSVLQNQGMTLQDVANTGAFSPDEIKQWASASPDPWLKQQVAQPIVAGQPQRTANAPGAPAATQTGAYSPDPYDMGRYAPSAQTTTGPSPMNTGAPPPAVRTGGPSPSATSPVSPWPGQQSSMGAQPWANANPATNWMAQNMIGGVGDMLTRQALPAIDSNAVAAGGVGGSRQGVAQGLAIGDAAKGLSQGLGSLYSGQYNADRNYGLQSDGLDFNIYQGNNAIQRQAQQDQLGLADKMLGWNASGLNFATQAQNTPLNYWQQFGNQAAQFGGLGGTQSQQMQGNPALGAIGGALSGWNLYNSWGK